MRTFDGQSHWIIVGTEGGLFTGYQSSLPSLNVILIDWDGFSTGEEDLEDIGERLAETLPYLRSALPPGTYRKNWRRDLVRDYRLERPLGTRWWE